MYKENAKNTDKKLSADNRLLNAKQLMSYLSVGYNKALQIGKDSGARVVFGNKMVRYDKSIIDAYIEKSRDTHNEED